MLTSSTFAWAIGSWWQSRVSERLGTRWLTTFGALLIATGGAVVAVGLLDVPVVVPYVGWAIGDRGHGHRVAHDPALGDGRGQGGT